MEKERNEDYNDDGGRFEIFSCLAGVCSNHTLFTLWNGMDFEYFVKTKARRVSSYLFN